MSLKFDEDLGKSKRMEDDDKVKKKKRWQNQEGSKQLKGNDKKRSRQELMAKTREEVCLDLSYFFVIVLFCAAINTLLD